MDDRGKNFIDKKQKQRLVINSQQDLLSNELKRMEKQITETYGSDKALSERLIEEVRSVIYKKQQELANELILLRE